MIYKLINAQARRAPFEPLLRVMSSLFRQIFSESDVNTSYHVSIRQNSKSLWPLLSKMLELPENLMYGGLELGASPSAKVSSAEIRDSLSMQGSSVPSPGNRSSVFLRGSAANQSSRFLNVFLEVLKLLTAEKLICLCLDDLQYADDESIDLILNIVACKIQMVIITTCRSETEVPTRIKSVVEDEHANVTCLPIRPLSEDDVISYIEATLHRSRDYVAPLAAVALDKTSGNPFYLQQMLDVCYRKHCIWYSWKLSCWEYNLDRVFSEFESESYGQQLNTSFLTKRLKDQLPPASRSILAWASLLGSTFSFAVVQKLMTGEFDYVEDSEQRDVPVCAQQAELFMTRSAETAVEGLQACLTASILVSGESDDQFR